MPIAKPVHSMNYYLDLLKERSGKSDRQICEMLGKDASYVSQLRKGRALPSDDAFYAICEAIGFNEPEMEYAYLRLAFWRADGDPKSQNIWNSIGERLPTLALPLLLFIFATSSNFIGVSYAATPEAGCSNVCIL
ncbi:MAG: XRE family transcriptional regulator [Rhodospirillaceae bacterium]|nr:MAG: XRE family transcriptional regulator [Rhodospirillaceae bacterium]